MYLTDLNSKQNEKIYNNVIYYLNNIGFFFFSTERPRICEYFYEIFFVHNYSTTLRSFLLLFSFDS